MRTMFPDYKCDETYDGELITGLVPLNGKLYIFTPTKIYTYREFMWYEQVWMRVKSVFRTIARKLSYARN